MHTHPPTNPLLSLIPSNAWCTIKSYSGSYQFIVSQNYMETLMRQQPQDAP